MPRMERAARDGIVVLTLTEDFTPELISEFKAHVEEAVSEGHHRVLVDAGQAKYINSTAFGALVKARGDLRAEGGELGVAALSGMPKETFNLLQLGAMIKHFTTVAEGLQDLQWVDVASTAVPDGAEITLEFRFSGPDEILVAGDGWQAAALQTIGERDLQFLWQAPAGLDLFRVFVTKAPLELRTVLEPGAEPTTLTAEGAVLNVVPAPEDAALVQVALVDPDDAFREAVRKFVRGH